MGYELLIGFCQDLKLVRLVLVRLEHARDSGSANKLSFAIRVYGGRHVRRDSLIWALIFVEQSFRKALRTNIYYCPLSLLTKPLSLMKLWYVFAPQTEKNDIDNKYLAGGYEIFFGLANLRE